MLGSNDEPLQGAYWSPLYLAAEQSLVNRMGLVTFFHDYLREAVKTRYLSRKKQRQEIHLRLANYFENRPLGPRQVDELAWQLSEAEGWQRLSVLLTEPDFFAAAWDK